MTVAYPDPTAQRAHGHPYDTGIPAAKQRIIETADRLFYQEGIRAVGIDRLISESSVTKATFYKHYGAKDRLILEYLAARHRVAEERFQRLLQSSKSPVDAVHIFVAALVEDIHRPGFRGCAFLNAASEFPDPRHPVREVVTSHREWMTDVMTDVMRKAGHPMPGDAADDILLARDGALAGGYAGDPISSSAALQRAVDRVLKESGH